MGLDWHFACVGCREHAWLGSVKPWKWRGFQIGNRYAAELFALHGADGCAVEVRLDERWEGPGSGWREDLRSCRCWNSYGRGTDERVCGQCLRPLGGRPCHTIGRLLSFCGSDCFEAYRDAPGRCHRPAPSLPPSVAIAVCCEVCTALTKIPSDADAFERDVEAAEAFAEWLHQHASCGAGAARLLLEPEDLARLP